MSDSAGSLALHATFEPRGPAAAIVLTDEQVAALGGTKSVPVRVTVNGGTVAARVARMGGENLLGVSKKLRAELGIEIGDSADVLIVRDDAPREVEVPPDLAAALAGDPAVAAAFEALAFTHRKEYVRWINEAKRDQTRTSRVAKTVEMVRAGQTRT